MALFLVRHGRTEARPGVPPHLWELDPAGFDDVWALRESGRLPPVASWFCAPEPRAVATAQLLTESDIGVLDELHESPDETVAACRDRVVPAVRRVLDVHAGEDVVLVGHGTAWTVVVAELTGTAPDLARWADPGMPDPVVLPD